MSLKFLYSLITLITVVYNFQFKAIQISSTLLTINQLATYTLLIQRQYDSTLLPSAWDTQLVPTGSNIVISFPSDYIAVAGTCSLVMFNFTIISNYNCTISGINLNNQGRSITITNAILTPLAISDVKIQITGVYNPSPALTTGNFIVSIGNDISAPGSSATLTLDPGQFSNCTVYFDPGFVNTTGKMVLAITPSNQISSNGTVSIKFPPSLQWARDISVSHMIPIDSSLICSNTTSNINSLISCSGQLSTQTITVSNIFSVPVNSSFGFSISSLFSPPTTQPIDSLIITSYSGGFPIDQCITKISNLKPQIMNVTITPAATLFVNGQVGLRFDFNLTDTITKNDIFKITFPTNIQIFYTAYVSTLTFSSISSANNTLTLQQVTSAANQFAGKSSYFTFVSIIGPPSIRTTTSITLRILLNNYEKIIGSNTITAIAKTYTCTVSVGNSTINIVTSYTLSIQLTDALTSTGYIVINIPTQLTLQSNLSISLSGSSTGIKSTPLFTISNNSITITQINSTQNIIQPQSLNIIINNLRNPLSVQTISAFNFSIYYTSSTIDLIANGNSITIISTSTAMINSLSVSVSASSLVTFQSNVNYNFTFNNTNLMPAQGRILLQFPLTVVVSTNLSVCTMIINKNQTSSIPCVFQLGNKVLFTLPSLVSSSSSITLLIPNCINPMTTQPTSNFVLTTLTSTNSLIDTLNANSSVNIVMNSLAKYSKLTLSRTSITNNAIANFTFKISHASILENSAILAIKFPSQVNLSSNLLCLNENSVSLICSIISGNTLSITFQTVNTSLYQYWITIVNITNPSSFEPTSSLIVETFTANQLYKYNRDDTTLIIVNSVTSLFNSVAYTFSNRILGEANTLTFTLQLNGNVWSLILIPASSFVVGSIICNSSSFIVQCSIVNNTINIANSPNSLPTNLTISVIGLTNPSFIPADFTIIRSYNLNNYLMSQSLNDIILTLNCALPCRSCANGTICLSCYLPPITNKPYLNLGSCLSSCPIGTYNNSLDYTCPSCSVPCLTCQNQPTYCTSCNTSSTYSYLNSTSTTSTCLSQCPPYLYADLTQVPIKCILCVEPCSTCTSITNCTTCAINYYYDIKNKKCVTVCPSGTSITNNISRQCDTCSSQCATCDVVINNCTSCSTSAAFYNNTCVLTCPNNLIIYQGFCVGCTTPCLTCSIIRTNCTSCNINDTFAYYYQNTCLSVCPNFYYPNSFKNCQSCIIANISCKNCSSATTCISCDPGYVLLNQKCYVKAPPGYLNISDVAIPCQGDCETCQITLTNCTSCKSLYLSENACVANCSAGYLGINKLCQPCTFPCQTCTQLLTKCTSCLVGNTTLYLSNFQCLANCQAGTFPNNGSFTCDLCVAPCQTCTTVSDCLSCATGFLSGTHCVDNCSSGYVGLNRTCFLCSSSCKTCSNLRDNCTSCQPSFYYNPSTNTCPIQCPSPLINDNATMLCVSCVSPCLNCVNTTTTCTSCVFGKYLYNYECLDNCSNGYVGINKTCLLCSSPCQTCSNLQTNCTSCIEPLYYNPSTFSCLDKCPSSLIGDPVSLTCKICESPCLQCQNTTKTCTKCVSGKYLYSFQCLDVCPDGYYGLVGLCQTCNSSCKTCRSVNICTSCALPLIQYGTDCLTACPVGYSIIINNTCTQCTNPLCSNCSSNNFCYQCYSPAIYYNQTCYSSCPNGTQYNSSTCVTVQQKTDTTLITTLKTTNNLFPLPFTIVGFIIFIACFMSKLQNHNTYLVGIAHSLFGVLQSLSLGYLFYVYYTQDTKQFLIVLLFIISLGIIYFLNLIGLCLQNGLLVIDVKFLQWLSQCQNKTFFIIVSTIGLLINYKFKLILFTKLFNFMCFRARLQSVQKFRIFNLLSFIGLGHQGVTLYATIIAIIPLVGVYGTLFFTILDVIIITAINVFLSLIASRKEDNFFQQESEGMIMNKRYSLEEETINKTPLKQKDTEDVLYYTGSKGRVMDSHDAINEDELEDEDLSLSVSQNNSKNYKNYHIFQQRSPGNIHQTQVDSANPLNKGLKDNLQMIKSTFLEPKNKQDSFLDQQNYRINDYQSQQFNKNDQLSSKGGSQNLFHQNQIIQKQVKNIPLYSQIANFGSEAIDENNNKDNNNEINVNVMDFHKIQNLNISSRLKDQQGQQIDIQKNIVDQNLLTSNIRKRKSNKKIDQDIENSAFQLNQKNKKKQLQLIQQSRIKRQKQLQRIKQQQQQQERKKKLQAEIAIQMQIQKQKQQIQKQKIQLEEKKRIILQQQIKKEQQQRRIQQENKQKEEQEKKKRLQYQKRRQQYLKQVQQEKLQRERQQQIKRQLQQKLRIQQEQERLQKEIQDPDYDQKNSQNLSEQSPLHQQATIMIQQVEDRNHSRKYSQEPIQQITLIRDMLNSPLHLQKPQQKINQQINSSKINTSWMKPNISILKKQKKKDQIYESIEHQFNPINQRQYNLNQEIESQAKESIIYAKGNYLREDNIQANLNNNIEVEDKNINNNIEYQVDKSIDRSQINPYSQNTMPDGKSNQENSNQNRYLNNNNIKENNDKDNNQNKNNFQEVEALYDQSQPIEHYGLESSQQEDEEINHHPIKAKHRANKQALLEIIEKAEKQKISRKGHRNIQEQQKATTLKEFTASKEIIDNSQRSLYQKPPRPVTSEKNRLYQAGLQQINSLAKKNAQSINPIRIRKNTMESQQNSYERNKSLYDRPFLKDKSKELSKQISDIDFRQIQTPSEYDTYNQRYLTTGNTYKQSSNQLPQKPKIADTSRTSLKNRKNYHSKNLIKEQDINSKIFSEKDQEDLQEYYQGGVGSRSRSKSGSKSRQKSSKKLRELQKIYLQRLDIPKK